MKRKNLREYSRGGAKTFLVIIVALTVAGCKVNKPTEKEVASATQPSASPARTKTDSTTSINIRGTGSKQATITEGNKPTPKPDYKKNHTYVPRTLKPLPKPGKQN